MTADELRKAKELCERATPGPYEWALDRLSQSLYLRTTHSGRLHVLGFARWGMKSAAALFRGAFCLVRADELAKDIPGQEHNNKWNQTIDHPDADFMAYFDPTRVAALVEEVMLSRELFATPKRYTDEMGVQRYLCCYEPGPWDYDADKYADTPHAEDCPWVRLAQLRNDNDQSPARRGE